MLCKRVQVYIYFNSATKLLDLLYRFNPALYISPTWRLILPEGVSEGVKIQDERRAKKPNGPLQCNK